jgi:hypothetical protein
MLKEIVKQRSHIGELMGQIRDLEPNGPTTPSNASPPRTPRSNNESAIYHRKTKNSPNV